MDKKKLCHDADTVLELLYNTYYENVCTDDTDEIKQAIAAYKLAHRFSQELNT